MVDPKLSAGSADAPVEPAVGANGLVSSEEEPADVPEQQQSPAPLLERIRRDRHDLEAKIAKLKSYISVSSEMMTKLKDVPEMEERYEKLSATRADLVQNAVNLQQLLIKLKQSESRASTLAGRERSLAAETAARHQSDLAELSRELPPQVVADLDPEDRANYEKKRDLMKRINQSQEKLRAMEIEQQRLRMLKENVEWKLVEAKANRLGLQEKAHDLLHDMPGVHPAADATNWESTTAPDRSALESLNARLAALKSLPMESLDADAAQQLQERLQALTEKRLQLDSMAAELARLQRQSAEERPSDPPPATEDGAELAVEQEREQEREQLEFLQEHAAAMHGQRLRLQDLEQSVQAIKQTLSQHDQTLSPEARQQAEQEQQRSQQLLLEQEQSLQRRAEQVEASRQQLARLKQLMTAVEEAHASGQRLSDAVPHQLTELLASVHQLEKQPAESDGAQEDQPAGGEGAESQAIVQPDCDSQSRAVEYVELLRRLQHSVDSLGDGEHFGQ